MDLLGGAVSAVQELRTPVITFLAVLLALTLVAGVGHWLKNLIKG